MLFQTFTTAFFSCCLFLHGFSLQSLNACSVGLRSSDWLGQSIIFQFLSSLVEFVEVAVCFFFLLLSCYIIKFNPITLVSFPCKLAVDMFLLLPSSDTLSIKIIKKLHNASQMSLHGWDHDQIPSFPIFSITFPNGWQIFTADEIFILRYGLFTIVI